MYSADCASLAASYLTEALLHPNTEVSFSQIGKTQLLYIRKIATPFQSLLNKYFAPTGVVHTSTKKNVVEPVPPRVENPAPPRV